MQPAAHYTAAIEVLEEILMGKPAEKALLAWSRRSRYAGSKDRANVRDIVFDCLRRRSSYAAKFGMTARGLALGRACDLGELELFDGSKYGPAALSDIENKRALSDVDYDSLADEYDFPDFLEGRLIEQYGDQLAPLMDSLRDRAPVDLRVNTMKATKEVAADHLAKDHIFTESLIEPNSLRITVNPRRLGQSRAYNYGFVELQDLSSQIVSRFAGVAEGNQVLDYCAGGGGKSLALAMYLNGTGKLDAWDISHARMNEIPERATRAGVEVNVLTNHPTSQYDLVFVDAPCSGSGAWRRSPDAKWRLNQERLDELIDLQQKVLRQASRHVKKGGKLVYATCSILAAENQEQVQRFTDEATDFSCTETIELNPLNAGDGFFAAKLSMDRSS